MSGNKGKYTPDYMQGFPAMPQDFFSSPDLDLGWIQGLYETGIESMANSYGHNEKIQINPDNLADVKLNNFDVSKTFTSAIIYLAFWVVFGIGISFGGMYWCCCNECCCCCPSSVNEKGRIAARNLVLQQYKAKKKVEPEPSEAPSTTTVPVVMTPEQNAKKRMISIALMAIWLLFLFLIIVYAFGGTEEAHDAIANIHRDINYAFDDADKYLDRCMAQMEFLFLKTFEKLNTTIHVIIDDCDSTDPICDKILFNATLPTQDTRDTLQGTVDKFKDALSSVRKAISNASEIFDDKFEEYAVSANKSLYWFLTFFNVLYLAVFTVVFVGTILALVGKTEVLKIGGHQAIRWGIVFMFILPPFIVIQLEVIFVVVGVPTQVVCPAVRKLEHSSDQGPTKTASGKYKMPNYGQLMSKCEHDSSAYQAFHLHTVFNVTDLRAKIDQFKRDIDLPPPTAATTMTNDTLTPKETVEEIYAQVELYIEFVIRSVQNEAGKCLIAYNIIQSVVSLVCEKVPAPFIAYWYVIQFLCPLFVLIICTALYFERRNVLFNS